MSEHDNHDTVAKKATVTVKDPVDGSVKKKKRSRGSATNRRRAIHTHSVTVDERVMEAAQALVTKNTRIQIVSATEVMVVNR